MGPQPSWTRTPSSQGLLDLFLEGRHLRRLLQADQIDALGAGAQGGQSHVDGHIAAADDHHSLPAPWSPRPRLTPAKKSSPHSTPSRSMPSMLQLPAQLVARGVEDGRVLLLELLQGDVLADGDAGLELDPQVADVGQLRVEHVPRQPVFRDAQPQHAAQDGLGLEDGHRVAHAREEVGAGQPGRAGADDGHLGGVDLGRRLGLLARASGRPRSARGR